MASNWLVSMSLLRLVDLHLGWDCLVSQCIVGSHGFAPFSEATDSPLALPLWQATACRKGYARRLWNSLSIRWHVPPPPAWDIFTSLGNGSSGLRAIHSTPQQTGIHKQTKLTQDTRWSFNTERSGISPMAPEGNWIIKMDACLTIQLKIR